ncbi:MAG: hypothetical protein QOG99_3741 [Frankiales bacterium]|jgi:hypothetical protein|nr:hypothetical protein [Frankiales bacterium]
MRRTSLLVALLLLVGVSTSFGASADPAPGTPEYCKLHPQAQVCGYGADNGFVFGSGNGGPGSPGGGGSTGAAVGLADTYTVHEYAPTCTGNTRLDANKSCGGAMQTCQPAGQGLVRYWIWEAKVDRRTGKVLDPPGWVQQPGTVCFGPAQQGVPAAAAIGGILVRDFKDLVVVKGVAHVDPHGSTLVNFDNGFWTDAKTYVLAPVQILGHTVVVTAKPERFDWYFGDGAVAMDAGPGRQGATDVAHTYTDKGTVNPYVVITWSGTFTVDGGAALDVIGTATTTGDGTPLQVKEAKAQLVSG